MYTSDIPCPYIQESPLTSPYSSSQYSITVCSINTCTRCCICGYISYRGWRVEHTSVSRSHRVVPSLFSSFSSLQCQTLTRRVCREKHILLALQAVLYSSPANIPPVHRQIASFPGSAHTHKPGSKRAQNWERPGLIHHMSDVRWTRKWHNGEGTNRSLK